MSRPTFLDRFVHPHLAAVAIVGAALWLGSFLVAAAGLWFRGTGRAVFGEQLFFLSGLVGLLGMLVLAACACWLAGYWLLRRVRGRGARD